MNEQGSPARGEPCCRVLWSQACLLYTSLMAAARLDVPTLFLNAGPMLPAAYRGRHWAGNIVTEAVGWKRRGEIEEREFRDIEDLAEPCAGSCAMLGTAKTMCLSLIHIYGGLAVALIQQRPGIGRG